MKKNYLRHYQNILAKFYYQQVLGPYYARRYAADFDQVPVYVMFLGYPRSGHTLVGALLDAHPNAWIAHELDALKYIHKGQRRNQIFAKLIGRGKWFRFRNFVWTGYSYKVPGQWQGRYNRLLAIGDKRGGASTRWLTQYPGLLDRLQETVNKEIRIIHNVRNPFDNIATRAKGGSLNPRKEVREEWLLKTVDNHFNDVDTINRILQRNHPPVLTIRHEDFVAHPRETLSQLCDFVGLEHQPDYLDAASGIVRKKSKKSRQSVIWSKKAKERVLEKMQKYEFLQGYEF